MIEVLRNKNQTTKFQILVEIADRGPDVQQREIARKLEITPQAISEYIAQIISDGMLVSEGRSRYRVTNEGVNWVIRSMRELDSYNTFIQRAVNNISVCAAIAEDSLDKGQPVGLKMKGGLLFASAEVDSGATAVTTSSARPGEDIGVCNISGIIPLDIGRVTVLKVPSIERGGSRQVDYTALKKYVSNGRVVISLGLEALAALRRVGADFYQFGAADTAIEAARCGLSPLVVCVESETSTLVTRLDREHIRYELIDIEEL